MSVSQGSSEPSKPRQMKKGLGRSQPGWSEYESEDLGHGPRLAFAIPGGFVACVVWQHSCRLFTKQDPKTVLTTAIEVPCRWAIHRSCGCQAFSPSRCQRKSTCSRGRSLARKGTCWRCRWALPSPATKTSGIRGNFRGSLDSLSLKTMNKACSLVENRWHMGSAGFS